MNTRTSNKARSKGLPQKPIAATSVQPSTVICDGGGSMECLSSDGLKRWLSIAYRAMFSSPLLSPQRDELSLPATSKVLLTSLLISIISTYRSHIRQPFDGTIRRASLEYVLVPTAVSTTRRALSPCDVEGSLDKPVNLDNQHLSQPH